MLEQTLRQNITNVWKEKDQYMIIWFNIYDISIFTMQVYDVDS